jgi:hypothetical protein
MIYTLIFVIRIIYDQTPATSVATDFNSLEACQAAAAMVRKQVAADKELRMPVLFCAAKGEK